MIACGGDQGLENLTTVRFRFKLITEAGVIRKLNYSAESNRDFGSNKVNLWMNKPILLGKMVNLKADAVHYHMQGINILSQNI